MSVRLNTRADKIKFLKDFAAGKVNVADVLPMRTEFWVRYQGDHYATNEQTKETIEWRKLQEMKSASTNQLNFILWIETKQYMPSNCKD